MSDAREKQTDEFEVGDGVVFPPHGAGVVISREPAGNSGEDQIAIRITHSKMTLTVPSARAQERGVRKVIAPDQVDALLAILHGNIDEMPDNPQHRKRDIEARGRTGGAYELAQLICDLNGRVAGGTKLALSEQRSLEVACEHLTSELAVVLGIENDAARAMIDDALATEGA